MSVKLTSYWWTCFFITQTQLWFQPLQCWQCRFTEANRRAPTDLIKVSLQNSSKNLTLSFFWCSVYLSLVSTWSLEYVLNVSWASKWAGSACKIKIQSNDEIRRWWIAAILKINISPALKNSYIILWFFSTALTLEQWKKID